jgi:hypothetical protein
MRRLKRWTTLLPLALLVFAGGCSVIDQVNPFSDSNPPKSESFRFPDLPVPSGLSLNSDESFIFETPGTRAGTLVYTGFKKYETTVNFYRERMPVHGWKLINSIEKGESSMTFEKPGWSATIFIRTSYFRTRVSINIGPRGGSTEGDNIPIRPKEENIPPGRN